MLIFLFFLCILFMLIYPNPRNLQPNETTTDNEGKSDLKSGAPNDNFRKNICSEDDLRSRIFETFVVKFPACLPLLGFSNI